MLDSYAQLMKFQRAALRSTIKAMDPVIKSMVDSHVQENMKLMINASRAISPMLQASKAFDVSLVQKQINSLRIPPQRFTQQLNAMRSLAQTMEPFLQSSDIRIVSKSNQIFNAISNDPVGSFNEVVESSHKTQKIVADPNHNNLGDPMQLEKQSDDNGTIKANLQNSSDLINSTVENYQKSTDRSADKNLDLKKSIEFFKFLINVIYLLALSIGVSHGPDQALQFILISLDALLGYLNLKDSN